MAARGATEAGRTLAALAADPARDGDLTERLLERWCAESGARGAALYLGGDGVIRREREVGEGPFPATAGDELPAGMAALPLPGGRLLYVPAAREGEAAAGADGAVGTEPLHLALALLARICTLKREIKRQSFAASFRGVEQQALYDVGLVITSTLNLDDLSEAILTWALALLDARRAALYLLEDGTYRLSRALGGDAQERCTPDDGELPEDLLPGASHLLTVAIEIDEEPRGLLVVGDKESRHGVGPFGDPDRRTLSLFANQAAIALENAYLHRQALEKERLEREMVLAAEIQQQILPKSVPRVPGFEVAGWSRPARQVGGDYYDLLTRPGGELVATLGDVSGKGMPAALMVSTLHSALRLMLDRHPVGPELIERLNRHVLDSSAANKFITLIVGQLDPATARLSYVNAGHNAGVVLDAGGGVRQLPAGGMPVGIFADATYESGTVELGPGDLVCLYSDGITECSDPQGEELGMERFLEVLTRDRDAPLLDIVAALDQAVLDFAQGAPQGDDQTVVLLRRRG